MKRLAAVVIALLAAVAASAAHEVRPAYLELRQTGAETFNVLWKVPGLGNELRLALYVDLPSGTTTVGTAHSTFVGNAFVERWTLERKNGLTGTRIGVSGLNATMTDALVRVQRLDGTIQVARLTPAASAFVVEASPTRTEIGATYLKLGIEHIVTGYDHLLFLLALILIVGTVRRAVAAITAFTIAHSIALAGAALGAAHLPQPPVEAAIALSIVFVAAEAVRVQSAQDSLTARFPWLVAFSFGLLHGFGFAGGLMEIGLPQTDVPLALFTFNAGVEIGQLIFVMGLFLAAALASRTNWIGSATSISKTGISYGIGVLAMFWVIDRIAGF
jgi:hydrogenase/urease accessory protein HupE